MWIKAEDSERVSLTVSGVEKLLKEGTFAGSGNFK